MAVSELKDAILRPIASGSSPRAAHWHLPHFPAAVRAIVRRREIWIAIVASLIGSVIGLAVAGMGWVTQVMHTLLYRLPPGERLSSAPFIATFPGVLMPAIGGVVLGLVSFAVLRVRRNPVVDPIEANALHGGRMSVVDSAVVMTQTILSSGFGASVGLEAAYTQVGSVTGSRVGTLLKLRRNDVRVLVGAGAAAGIAAAFGAPFTGAFYGFELIVGTYSVATVAPVMGAAIAAALVAHAFGVEPIPIGLKAGLSVEPQAYPVFVVLGLVAGLAGIAVMRSVTIVEAVFRWMRVPSLMRPAMGGVLVGAMALLTPQVLSSGHGALHNVFAAHVSVAAFAALFLLKALAASISLGSGFRGGLFFASLFLGALLGKIFAGFLAFAVPALAPDPLLAAVVGMSAFAVAVVGGPLTMTFLALEASGDLVIAGAVLSAAIVSSITVRELFGYSFSTWRLHLRGETIRSAHDVGWIRSLTAGRMMRHDVKTVREEMPLAEFRNKFPIGSKQRVVALDAMDRYAGLIHVPDAYSAADGTDPKASRVVDLLHHQRDFLTPELNVKQAIEAFDRTESEAMIVVDTAESRQVLGLLTEQHALRRYAEELDKVRQGLSGTI